MSVVAVRKLSISLNEDVAAAAVRVVERKGVSVSTWLNRAAEQAIRVAEGRAAVQQYFAEHGEPSDEARVWSRDVIANLRTGEPRS